MQANRRDIMKAVAASAVVTAIGSWPLNAAPRMATDPFAGVDPEMIDDLRLVKEMTVTPSNLAAFRTRPPSLHAHPLPEPAIGKVPLEVRTIPGLPGQPPVRTLIFDGAPGRKARGALIWIHGGGYVAGSAGIGTALRVAAQEQGWLIVSVDYRLAPEAPFPASLNDNYAALKWVHDNAAQLGVDRQRIAVGGSSAGGGHSAMLAIAARDRGEIPVAFQVLIYPMLDDRTASSRPAKAGTGRFIWTPEANRFGWASLLGRAPGGASAPAGAVPARVASVKGLPPAFIGVGTLDLFYDEDIAYAEALTRAGIAVDLAVVPAAFHAFDGVAPSARASKAFTERWLRDLSVALAG